MILLVGDPHDETSVYLGWLAETRGWDVSVLDEERFGIDWSVERAGDGGIRAVTVHDRRIAWHDVDGAVVRFGSSPAVLPTIGIVPRFRRVYAAARRAEIAQLLADAPFPVINRPGGAPDSDPAEQIEQLVAFGFRVPDTIVTDDPGVAACFTERHCWNVIAKATPGHRPFTGWWSPELAERMVQRPTPVVLQQYVAGDDVRVHVAGDAVFATAIDPTIGTDDVDSRLDAPISEYRPTTVPAIIRQLCLIHTRCAARHTAAFHFRVSVDGTWWCHTVEADPDIVRFDMEARHQIGNAVLDLIDRSFAHPAPRVALAPDPEPAHRGTVTEPLDLVFV